jgi:hypothetical protein
VSSCASESLPSVSSLVESLAPEVTEACVVSFAGVIGADSTAASLAYASVLFAPAEVATLSWLEWHARTDRMRSGTLSQWQAYDIDLSAWVSFVHREGSVLFARGSFTPGDIESVTTWLDELLSGLPVEIPQHEDHLVTAQISSPDGRVRALPHLASPASSLVLATGRPVDGYRFPLEIPLTSLPAPETAAWHAGDQMLFHAPSHLLGLPVSDPPLLGIPSDVEGGVKPGLFVGRMERRAWLTQIRAQADPDPFLVAIGFDPTRIMLSDIEVDLEEYAHGDLIEARRLRLEDLNLPATASPPGSASVVVATVALPTLGSGLQRQVRVYDRDGLLLDGSDRVWMAEQVITTLTVNDAAPITISVGEAAIVEFEERIERAASTDRAYADLLEQGLSGRIIEQTSTGQQRLAELLSQAREHLDVLDPFFGWDSADWTVLVGVTLPIRILTQPRNRNHPLRQPPPTIQSQVSARGWARSKPPWHDRIYLWNRGGCSVGTSPSGLGKRLARIDPIGAAEAAGWQALFNQWWSDSATRAL